MTAIIERQRARVYIFKKQKIAKCFYPLIGVGLGEYNPLMSIF